jgi:NADPH2:quinone reductase
MTGETGTDEIQAVVVTAHGGAEVLEIQTRPAPEPGPGQLLVRVEASGVNFKDVYQRQGIYPGTPPFVLGDECAGRVVAVGANVEGFAEGDLVAAAGSASGAHATLTLLDAAQTIPVPDGVSAETAAAAMLQGMTAHYLVHSTFVVSEGHTVLVHAAAGGTGALIVQMAKAQGATVIATVGSAAKADIATAAGADHVLRYDELDDLAAAVRALAPEGVHVAYDGVGKSTFDASLASLRRRGTLVLFGAASGQVPPFELQRLNSGGSLFVTRPTLAHYISTRDELVERSGDVLAAAANGTLDVAIGGRYPLADAARAYDDLEGRRTTGKLLIVPTL